MDNSGCKEFSGNSLVFCEGTLPISENASNDPILSVHLSRKSNYRQSYETLHLAYIMAPKIRCEKVESPSTNSYVQAIDEIMRFTTVGSAKSICVLLAVSLRSLHT